MGLGRARRHHQPVEPLLADALGNLGLRVPGTREHHLLGVRDPRQALGVFHHRRDIHHPGDVGAAVADEYPGAQLTVGGNLCDLLLARPDTLLQVRQGSRRRRGTLCHRVGNVARAGGAAGEIDPVAGAEYQLAPRLGGGEEAVVGHRDVEHRGKLVKPCRRHQRVGQHYHVVGLLADESRPGVLVADAQRLAVVVDARRATAHVLGTHLHGALVELVELLAEGADVHVVRGDLGNVVVQRLYRLLGGVHAADARAVGDVLLRARPDAVDEGHRVGVAHVRRAEYLAFGRAGGVHQPLELHRRQDVGMRAVTVGAHRLRVLHLEAGGDDDRRHAPFVLVRRRHGEIYGPGLARADAAVARQVVGRGVEAVFDIDDVGRRYRLREGSMDRLARGHGVVELVGQRLGTRVGTVVTAGTGVGDVV